MVGIAVVGEDLADRLDQGFADGGLPDRTADTATSREDEQ